jgi:GNAT superfamily N-acetyltransferase
MEELLMHIRTTVEPASQIWVIIRDDAGNEMARGSIMLVRNKLYPRPYAYVEDVFTQPAYRSQGLFHDVMRALIDEAKARDCYKIVAGSRTARPKVHALYLGLGFADHGKEFRMDLP